MDVPPFDQEAFSPPHNGTKYFQPQNNIQTIQIFTPGIVKEKITSVLKTDPMIYESPAPSDQAFPSPRNSAKKDNDKKVVANNEIRNLIAKDFINKTPWDLSDGSPKSVKPSPKLLVVPKFCMMTSTVADQDVPILPISKSCCNCQKSRCLKLYCDCFSNQRICQSHCNCVDCLNTKHSKRKERAIELALKKNPQAFESKLTARKIICRTENNEQKQIYSINCTNQKSCNCRNSQCQKKYCDCFRLNISCTQLCKCEDCRNGKFDQQEQNQTVEGVVVE